MNCFANYRFRSNFIVNDEAEAKSVIYCSVFIWFKISLSFKVECSNYSNDSNERFQKVSRFPFVSEMVDVSNQHNCSLSWLKGFDTRNFKSHVYSKMKCNSNIGEWLGEMVAFKCWIGPVDLWSKRLMTCHFIQGLMWHTSRTTDKNVQNWWPVWKSLKVILWAWFYSIAYNLIGI